MVDIPSRIATNLISSALAFWIISCLILGVISNLIYLVLYMLDYTNIELYNHIAFFFLGISFGILVVGVLYTSKYMNKLRDFKLKLLKKKD